MSRRAARAGRFTEGLIAFGGNVFSMFARGTGGVMDENAPEGLRRNSERNVTTFRESIRGWVTGGEAQRGNGGTGRKNHGD
jgi:hypothetical protein